MKNLFYRLEIISESTIYGRCKLIKDIKRDFLMTSSRIALLYFEEHFEYLQSGELQKKFRHCIAGDTFFCLSLYLVEEGEKGKEQKNTLLQKVQSVGSANHDYELKLLEAEQNAITQYMEQGQLPYKHAIEDTHFYRRKIWNVDGEKLEVAHVIDYSFGDYLEAYREVDLFSKKKSKTSFSELILVETDGQKQKEYHLTKNGKKIFGEGFLIEKDVHLKFGFELGINDPLPIKRIPEVFPGEFDKAIYSWTEV